MAAIPATVSSNSHYFKVYAAVDFGTDGTGLAYCLPNNDKVYVHNKWKRWNSSKNYGADWDDVASIKPKTAILLDRNGNFKAFGDNALQMYLLLKDNELMLFEHFKMNLYTKPHYVNNDDDDQKQAQANVKINDNLTAMNGRQYPSSKVFIAALEHLKNESLHVFKRNKIKIRSNTDVCWILTVPAIWDDIAKAKMKEWAIAAGMIDPNLKNHLLLRYEPDCASLSIQNEIMGKAKTNVNKMQQPNSVNDDQDQKIEPKFFKKEKYLLIDAGGGTVDIACHQIEDNKTAKELLHPSGGPWGDMYIDQYFMEILYEIFEKEWIEEFKQNEPNHYLALLDNFRRAKWNFMDFNDKEYHHITFPVELVEFLDDKLEALDNSDSEDRVTNFVFNGEHNCFSIDAESFQMHCKIWKKYLFDKLINPTINHCKTLLAHPNMKNCKYLCIVGGFGAIDYFQKKIKSEFGRKSKYKLDIIIPERPILSVLDGAARMAIKKNYIKSRRLARTYGIGCSRPLKRVKDTLSNDFINEYKFWNTNKSKWYVNDCMQIYAKVNQEVQENEVITDSLGRSDPTKQFSTTYIYCSDKEDPVSIYDSCQHLASLKIDFAGNTAKHTITEFHFYDTSIKVFSYPEGAPDKKKQVQLKYNI